jgi:hypothetical protein
MSQFGNILSNRHLPRHNGQSLWKYSVTDSEFNRLRLAIMETKSLNSIDARDCTLYYSEWWKRCYNGSLPSKKEVFKSISSGQWYDEEAFYQYARKGANLLGIRWIKNQNTLFFRTLLLQGGLPVKHIANNKGAYKNFLLKILEINPSTIDDFAFDPAITSLLPASSRNDEVYECCLGIVKAIINEDREYLAILDNNRELNDISNELRIKKQRLIFGRKKSKFRATWIFEPTKEKIRLYLGLPDMDAEDFRNLFLLNNPNPELEFEYKLFYNDQILCKLIKKANNQFKTIWINKDDLVWDGTDQFSELYLIDPVGNKYDCKHLITYLPKLHKPTLWAKYSDAQWILEKGCNTTQEEGFILSPDNFTQDIDSSVQRFTIYGKPFKWSSFTNTIVLSSQSVQHQFTANSKKFEWYIADEKPTWMQRANLPVVRRKPKVLVFDGHGNLIPNTELKWRQKPNNFWNSWNTSIPLGLVELQIQANNVIEFDDFFNIGALDIKIDSNSLHQADVEFLSNLFLAHMHENSFVSIEKINANKLRLKLKDNKCLPSAIQVSLKSNNQGKPLRFEIFPPFKGIEIIDNDQNIVTNGSSFNITNLYGYRLMSNSENLIVNIYNTKRKNIIISESIKEKFIPLRTFEDEIDQLYTLSDSMDGDAEIIIEICEEKTYSQTKLREYRVRRYNQKIIVSHDDNNKSIIHAPSNNSDLYAVPLDCANEDLNLLDLENIEGHCSFKSVPKSNRFIVFCSKDTDAKVQPAFVSLDQETEVTPNDRLPRIIKLRDQLISATHEEDVWQQFLTYYKICFSNDLSYSTFDILRSIGFSSELAAKAFVFLMCYDNNESFADSHKKLEQDLGFCFHWVNREHWDQAMGWIGCYTTAELMPLVTSTLKSYFDNLYPSIHFNQISNYVMKSLKPKINGGYHLNGRILDLRSSLGSKVLSELPQKCPKVPEIYKDIIPVNDTTANVKILLKSPLAVALSISGKDETLWDKDNEYIRRNVKYSYQVNPEWYSEAINYCLTKL